MPNSRGSQSTNNLRNQIASLQRKLARLETGNGGPRQTTNRGRRNQRGNRRPVNALTNQARPTRPLQGSSRGGAGSVNTTAGTIRLSRREYITTIGVPSSVTDGAEGDYIYSSVLTPLNFPWLKTVASAFDRVIWHQCRVEYRSACATTASGMLTMGIDWDVDSKLTAPAIRALTPVVSTPVWQSATMTLPPGRLMTRKEYVIDKDDSKRKYDSAPGIIYVNATSSPGVNVGELWVYYDLSLFGTQSAA